MIKRALFFFFLLLVAPLFVYTLVDASDTMMVNTPVSAPSILPGDEELVYEVSWSLFKLGTIRVNARKNLTAEAHIDSYENLPFVDLHSIHFSTMDSLFYSRGSRSLEQKDGLWWGLDYLHDLDHGRIRVEETYQKNLNSPPTSREIKDTLSLSERDFVDGLSIAYFPRRFIHTHQTVRVPTVLYGKLGVTTFHFTGEETEESLGVLDGPVKMVVVDGTTSVVGIFGMTGEFRGWFSDDAAAVPLKGRLNVLLGSVDVELISWNRVGWSPPRAHTDQSELLPH